MVSTLALLVSVIMLHGFQIGDRSPIEPIAANLCPATAGKIRDVGDGAPAKIGRNGTLKAILICRFHGLPSFGLGAPEGGPTHVGDLIAARRLHGSDGIAHLVASIKQVGPSERRNPGLVLGCVGDLDQKIYLRFVYRTGPPETAVAFPTGCTYIEFGKARRSYRLKPGLLRQLQRLVPPKRVPPRETG